MEAHVFDATRMVRPTLLTIALYISIIIISSMTMLKPAYASGTVAPVTAGGVLYADPGHTRPVTGYGPDGTITNFAHQYWYLLPYPPANYQDACVTGFYADISSHVSGWMGSQVGVGGYCVYFSSRNAATQFPNDWVGTFQTCPANATGTATCICNTDFKPDPTSTSCVPANSCPVNMTGSPCVCISGGYVPNPNGAGCVEEQYTLSEPQDQTQLPDVEPGKPQEVTARVTSVQTGQPKQGAVVRFRLDVDLTSGGHDHGEAYGRRFRGTISSSNCVPESGGTPDTYDCTTGAEGYTGFTFNAPDASGKHTITATCISHACSGSKTGKIDVKVGGLETIMGSPFYAFIGATNQHSDNHYLTPQAELVLRAMAAAYQFERGFKIGGVVPLPLHLNDASLVWGGKFDVKGNWADSHAGHRRGVVIDVRANDDTAATGAIPRASFDNFTEMAATYDGAEAQVHCTSNKTDGQNRQPPSCIGRDGSQDSNRHMHILLLGVDQ